MIEVACFVENDFVCVNEFFFKKVFVSDLTLISHCIDRTIDIRYSFLVEIIVVMLCGQTSKRSFLYTFDDILI